MGSNPLEVTLNRCKYGERMWVTSARNRVGPGDVSPFMQATKRTMLAASVAAILSACAGGESGTDATAPRDTATGGPLATLPSPSSPPTEGSPVDKLVGSVLAREPGCLELQTSGGRFALLGAVDLLLPGAYVIVHGRAVPGLRPPCAGTPFRVSAIRQVGVHWPSPTPPDGRGR